uniref:Uncharacterized protein n=1 Tax=Anguilla anguilla TaxID=7936 RepID=A0A0E9V513_ANGAN
MQGGMWQARPKENGCCASTSLCLNPSGHVQGLGGAVK